MATRNAGKVRELAQMLGDAVQGLEVLSLAELPGAPEVEETADTFEGNAAKKALEICRFCGLPCLADDSGLVVDALGGQPGVLSARFSGEGATDAANLGKLLELLENVPADERAARFRCVVAVAVPATATDTAGDAASIGSRGAEPAIALFAGTCEGTIGFEPRGHNGFGYDPVFAPEGHAGRTFAQLADHEKNAISHRGRALQAALPFVEQLLAGNR